MKDLLTPREAAERLQISAATITRCVKRGAPVHRWGSTGRRYRIDPEEFQRWMEHQGQDVPMPIGTLPMGTLPMDVEEMARRRRASVRAV